MTVLVSFLMAEGRGVVLPGVRFCFFSHSEHPQLLGFLPSSPERKTLGKQLSKAPLEILKEERLGVNAYELSAMYKGFYMVDSS